MKKFLPVFLAVMLICGNCFAASTDIGLEALFNRVFDPTNNGIKAVISGEAEALTKATITSTSTTESAFTIDVNATTGTTGVAGLLLDSENTDTMALYINSKVDGSGTNEWDDYAATILSDGVGGSLFLFRDINAATIPLFKVYDKGNVTTKTFVVESNCDATSNNDMATFKVIDAGFDRSAIYVDFNSTSGTTLNPAVHIDSECVNVAGLAVFSAVDGSGTSSTYDDHALAVVSEGLGGALKAYRNVVDANQYLVHIHEDSLTSGKIPALYVQIDANANATSTGVLLQSTSNLNDQPVCTVQQAGPGVGLLIDSDIATSATALPAVRVDSENTDTAAVFITSAVDGSGSSSLWDDYALVSVSEGTGGAGIFYRNVASSTKPIVVIEEANATNTLAPLYITQAAAVSTNFKICMNIAGVTMYISDGTTAEGNLTGVKGDICLNGASGTSGAMAYCDANGTNWTDM